MFVATEQSFGKGIVCHQKRRPVIEKRWLKWAHVLTGVILLFCFMVTTIRVKERADKTVKGFWDPASFALKDSLAAAIQQNCGKHVTVEVFQWDARLTLQEGDRDYLMARTTGLIRRAIWISGAAVFLAAANKILFILNYHEFNYAKSRFVAPKGYLVALEIFAIIWSIAALEQPIQGAKAIDDYLSHCAPAVGEHLWSTDWSTALFVAHAFTLTLYMLNWALWLGRTGACDGMCRGSGHQTRTPYNAKRYPAIRRWWREVSTVVAAATGSVPPMADTSACHQLENDVTSELRVLYYETQEIAEEYRRQVQEKYGNTPQ